MQAWEWLLSIQFACTVAGCAERLPITTYTTSDGLAHDHINRIVVDSRGFLWICTDDGLSRWDGHQFVNYTTSSGLPHMYVNDLLETRSSDYWIATDGGVTRFYPKGKPKRFVTYAPAGPAESLHINALVEERDGAILLGTSAGLYRLKSKMGQAYIERLEFGHPIDIFEGGMVNCLRFQGDGSLWLGAASGLYRRAADGGWTRYTTSDGLLHNFVRSLTQDRAGRLWLCTNGGAARISLNPEPGAVVDLVLTTKDGLPHPDVRYIWFGSDGRRWISTAGGGLAEWLPDPAGKPRFRIFSTQDGLADQNVYGFAEDPAGNLWIGSRRGGIMRLAHSEFRSFDESDGLMLSGDDTLLETVSGEICVASVGDSRRPIRCLEGDHFRVTAPQLPPDVITISPQPSQTMVQDHVGGWWISTSLGLFRYPGAPRARDLARVLPQSRLLTGMATDQIFEDRRGNLWVGVCRAGGHCGFAHWERSTGRLADLGALWGFPVGGFAEDRDGQVWIGVRGRGGLARWRDGRLEQLPGIQPISINSLYVDHANRLWIASAVDGLGRIDRPNEVRPQIRRYTRADGLSANEVWCLVEDRFGRLYAGTSRGVDRIDVASGAIMHYSVADGLVQGDIRSALRDRQNHLWFASNHGISRLTPVRESTLPAPQARITAIRVQEVPQALSDLGETEVPSLELRASQNSIQVDFSAIDYRAPAQLRYQLRLDGAEESWSSPTSNSTVRYANLAPGRYRFLVQAINSAGQVSPAPAAFAFTILQPLWRRWWSLSLLAVTAGVVGYAVYRYRVTRLLELERVRTRIATDLHDDIGSSLSRIAVLSELIQRKIGAIHPEAAALGLNVAETARGLMEVMGDIVWSIDPRRDDLNNLILRIRQFASDALEAQGIAWDFQVPPEPDRMKLTPEQRRHVFLIIKEAINNVMRHAGATTVRLTLSVTHHQLQMQVLDNGRGFSPPPPDSSAGACSGYGLGNMRERAAKLRGSLQVKSQPAEGTCIILKVPLS
jgi:signal transduction histidine kinase/ligand-binding sensor domain-containing protein